MTSALGMTIVLRGKNLEAIAKIYTFKFLEITEMFGLSYPV